MSQLQVSKLNPPINGKQYAYAPSTGEVFDITGGQVNQLSGSAADSIKNTYGSQIKQLQNPKPTQPPPAAGAQGGNGPNGGAGGQGGAPAATFDTPLKDMSDEFKTGGGTTYDKVSSLLFYPENIGTSGQDKVVISQFQYVAGKLGKEDVLGGSLGNRDYQLLFDENGQRKKPLGTVVLPMVNNLSETNQTGWGEDSLSTVAAALMQGGTAAAKDLSGGNLIGAFGEASQTLVDTLKAGPVGTRAAQYLSTRAAASVIQKIGIQINPEAYITRVTGSIVNPNMELLFNGPKLRAFELAFKMTPRSQKEAASIRKIIKFFKKGMAPRKGRDGGDIGTFFLGTPNIFKVQFKSGDKELQSLVEYKTCALVTCQVNYTPDGFYAAYSDAAAGGSQPIAATLQLGFAELTPVYNDDYDIEIDSVGPDRSLFEQNYVTKVSPTPSPNPPPAPVPGNPLLNPGRNGGPPVLGGPGTASRAGQQGAFAEWQDKFNSGATRLTFAQYKKQFYPNLP